MTDEEARDVLVAAAKDRANARPAAGIAGWQIFIISLLAIGGWQGVAAFVLANGPDPSDRAAILQTAINMATMAFGYYLGSSASSRNRDHRP